MANDLVVTGFVKDTNEKTIALTGNPEILIRYYSNAFASVGIESDAMMNPDQCSIRNGVSTISGVSGVFNNVESDTFYFSAADSNGNTGTLRKGVPFVEYQKLTCNIGNSRPDASGAMILACTGSFFNGSFGAVSNTLVVNYRYQENGGAASGWGAMAVTITGNAYYAYANITGLNYQSSYTFEILASDRLETVQTTTHGVRSVPLFHWGENDFAFEVPVSVRQSLLVDKDLYVNGDARFNGSVKLNGDGVEFGVWVPTLSSVGTYTALNGWYSKLGTAVTVGFHIKASIVPGYQDTPVYIFGLPFQPLYSAAGGGLCSGAFVGGGNTFQCFVAEPAGYIATRVQSCNLTGAANLVTSDRSCCYPYNGGELILSGTIVYTTAKEE